MSGAPAPAYGLVGALEALPRRLAARSAEAAGGRLDRGTRRRTTHAVFGRRLLRTADAGALEARAAAERTAGRVLLSETGFLAAVGLVAPAPEAAIGRTALLAASGLPPDTFDMLALFDAFERPAEPFGFRDTLLARQYAGLLAGGAPWEAIAQSVHRSGLPASLTALSLAPGPRRVYARAGDGLRELDGQLLLPLAPEAAEPDPEALFAEAEASEAAGDAAGAAALYSRCLALDPGDATAAFNRGNCLRATGAEAEAAAAYCRALQLDPALVEAWFNLACLARDAGRPAAARRHLAAALAIEPAYGDALFNLAALACEAGDLDTARAHWERYLAVDGASPWAEAARRGLRYVALAAAAPGTA